MVLPRVGFGTWPLRGEAARRAVRDALSLGYRLIDHRLELYGVPVEESEN